MSIIVDYDFLINNPLMINYNDIFKQKWKVIQLKKIAKNCGLKISGKKQELLVRIHEYLSRYKHIVCVQSVHRGNLYRRFIKLHGSYSLKNKCVNDTDFMTLEPLSGIPNEQFFTIKDNKGFVYGFDICSLYNLFKMQKLPFNPYNRDILDKSILKDIREIIRLSVILKINVKILIDDDESYKSRKNLSTEQRIDKVFQLMDEMGNYTNTSWFNSLNKDMLIIFVRELQDIWNYRLQLTDQVKRDICPPIGNPFSHINFNLFHIQTIEKIKIDAIKVMENIVFTGINQNSQTLGCNYCLAALTIVNAEAASVMPWFYQAVTQQ